MPPSFARVPGLRCALSTRAGGVSTGEFASLNLGFHVGDDPELVRENRRLFARTAGFEMGNLVAAKQVHGAGNRVVSREEAGRGALDWEGALPDCDALITGEPNLPMLILVADCAPVLLVDPRKRVCAVVHAGWRGALAGVAGGALETMKREFDSRAEEVFAAIGPCLSVQNLEVGEEVAAGVEAVNRRAVIRGFPKPHLDLRALIFDDLTRAGVEAQRVEISAECPQERDDLFSHRGQNGRAGRFGLVAWWDGDARV